MAILDDPMPSTALAVDDAKVAGRTDFDSIGINMSELGSECDRAIWLSLRWASEPEKHDADTLRRFETGNAYETRMLNDLEAVPGVTVVRLDPETGKQRKVFSHGGHVRGKVDGEALGLPEAPKTWHIVECKSHKNTSYNATVKHSIKKAKIAHWWQCQKYMQLRGFTRCLYYIADKNSDRYHTERIEIDVLALAQLDARLERIILSPTAPARIKDIPTAYPCNFCKQKSVCHREVFGRENCRTCLHSTPILDHSDTSAPWLCEKFNKILTVDEQRAGCHAHLYLPDFVPGDQVDATDDCVVYILMDGKEWVNQERKFSPETDIKVSENA